MEKVTVPTLAEITADIQEQVAAAPVVAIPPATDTAWHMWRRAGIGGSDIAGILGLKPKWSSPWKVWAEKVGLLEPTETTERQWLGKFLEPALDAMFHHRTGLHVAGQQTWVMDTDAPYRRCTPDGFAYESGPLDRNGIPYPADPTERFAGALGGLEHKTDWRRPWGDDIPPDIRAQVIWNMGVCHLQHWWLSVLHGGFQYEVYEIPWDDNAAADWRYMCDQADRFWNDHVLTGTAPDIDGSDATSEALAAVYPEETPGERAALEAGWVDSWRAWKAAAKRAEDKVKEAANTLRAQFGDAEIGTVDGRAVLTLRAQVRRTTCKACQHVEESEPFRVLREAPKKLRDLPAVPDA